MFLFPFLRTPTLLLLLICFILSPAPGGRGQCLYPHTLALDWQAPRRHSISIRKMNVIDKKVFQHSKGKSTKAIGKKRGSAFFFAAVTMLPMDVSIFEPP